MSYIRPLVNLILISFILLKNFYKLIMLLFGRMLSNWGTKKKKRSENMYTAASYFNTELDNNQR